MQHLRRNTPRRWLIGEASLKEACRGHQWLEFQVDIQRVPLIGTDPKSVITDRKPLFVILTHNTHQTPFIQTLPMPSCRVDQLSGGTTVGSENRPTYRPFRSCDEAARPRRSGPGTGCIHGCAVS